MYPRPSTENPQMGAGASRKSYPGIQCTPGHPRNIPRTSADGRWGVTEKLPRNTMYTRPSTEHPQMGDGASRKSYPGIQCTPGHPRNIRGWELGNCGKVSTQQCTPRTSTEYPQMAAIGHCGKVTQEYNVPPDIHGTSADELYIDGS